MQDTFLPIFQKKVISSKKNAKAKLQNRPESPNYFKFVALQNLLFTILLYIIYVISKVSYPDEVFKESDLSTYAALIIPTALLSLQLVVVAYLIKRQYLSAIPIVIYYLAFNGIITELMVHVINHNDILFLSSYQTLINYAIIQRLPRTHIKSLYFLASGGYYLLRGIRMPTILGFGCLLFGFVSLVSNEWNIYKILEEFRIAESYATKELKQLKKALQAIPDGVAILFEDIVCYSNPSIQSHLKISETGKLLNSFENIMVPIPADLEEENQVGSPIRLFGHLEENDLGKKKYTPEDPVNKSKKSVYQTHERRKKRAGSDTSDFIELQKLNNPKSIASSLNNSVQIDKNHSYHSSKSLIPGPDLDINLRPKTQIQIDDDTTRSLRFMIEMIMSNDNILPSSLVNVENDAKTLQFSNCTYQAEGHETKIFDVKIRKIVWNQDKPAVLVILVDQTVKSNAESLQKANKFKEAVLSYISHEVKTPLNAILANLNTLKDMVTEHIYDCLIAPSMNCALLLQSTLTDIDLINRIDNNDFNPKPCVLNVKDVIDDIHSLFEKVAQEKMLDFQISISKDAPETINVNKVALRQLLINLVSNAVKYTFHGFVKIEVERDKEDPLLYTKISVIDSGVGIKEKDLTKIGQVFNKQKGVQENLQSTGIGLGLYLSKHLARMICPKGGLNIVSSFGKGSQVSFRVMNDLRDLADFTTVKYKSNSCEAPGIDASVANNPGNFHPHQNFLHFKSSGSESRVMDNLNKPDNVTIGSFTEEPLDFDNTSPKEAKSFEAPRLDSSKKLVATALNMQAGKSDTTGLRSTIPSIPKDTLKKESELETAEIFIVDDNQLSVLALKNMLITTGLKVASAANGELAIEKILTSLNTQELRLIIMDINMPVMDGIECTKHLRKMMGSKAIPEIPIVVSSAVEEYQNEEYKTLFEEILPKPVDKKTLLMLVEKYVKPPSTNYV